MAQKAKETLKEHNNEVFDLSDSFIVHSHKICSREENTSKTAPLSTVPRVLSLPFSREQLVIEQKNDQSLSSLFTEAVPEKDIEFMPHGYFMREGILMRKWRPLAASAKDEWRILHQVVVPLPYRAEVLRLAHDHHFAGHLGINKTTDRIIRHFFWPGLKRDVAKHCKTCHICQVTGKPN